MMLDVGSIIYIIDPKKKSVMPARVNEQLVSKTLKGEKTTHNIEVPNGKVASLESLDVAYFTSLEEVNDFLLERAKEMISQSIQEAQKVADEKFNKIPTDLHDQPPIGAEDIVGKEVSVTLEDGRNVNVKLPEGF